MKASLLLEEIKDKISKYPIEELENRVISQNIDRVNLKIAKYNIENYNEIMNYKINTDFNIEDKAIEDVKNKMKLFFIKYPVELKEFEDFITYICIYLTYIAKKPLHPVGFYFAEDKPIYKENDKYYCEAKSEYIKNKTSMCHNCIASFKR